MSTNTFSQDPWPAFRDPREDESLHTDECLDYADETFEAHHVAYCIASCADARRAALS